MKNGQIQEILEKIGLREMEIACYLSLLKQSPQRASELSRKLDAPKATVLASLYRLADELGIIKRSKKKNSYLFLVEDAKDLVGYMERKENEIKSNKENLENILPELRSMQNFETKKPQVFYYEGRDGIKQAFEKVLEEADEIIGYGSNEDDYKYLRNLFPDYYARRVQKKIPVKALIPALPFNVQETLKTEIKHLRKTHLINKNWNYPIQVNIYKNTTVFYSFEESFALTIKSRPIAECLKKVFEMAFDKAEEYDNKIRNAHA